LILKFEQSSSKQILFLNDNSLFRIVLEKKSTS